MMVLTAECLGLATACVYAQYSVQDDQHESALVLVNDPVVISASLDIPELPFVPV